MGARRPLMRFATDDKRCKLQAFNLVGIVLAFDVSGVARDLGDRGPVLEDS